MTEKKSLFARVDDATRAKWFTPVLIAVLVGGAILQAVIWGPDAAEVTRRLEGKYGVEEVVWQGNGRYERDTLVVDGRDVSEECVVTGDWGPLDDLAIDCNGEVAFVPVDPQVD